ncbi:MAG: high-potential iron-sulfur protein [Oligoflexia bacterium]|nr:high-potential iron-sulfur protein [Oligoflexia bacterium]
MKDETSRREVLKAALIVTAAIPVVQAIGSTWALAKGEVALPAGEKEVSESDAVASALGYKKDAKAMDLKKYPQFKDLKKKNMICDNCALYTASNAGWGKCQMLTAGLVAAAGSCGSWQPKAKK